MRDPASGGATMQRRNLIILVFSQLISATGSIIFVTLGGIIGVSLAGNPAWATLPVSMVVVASAATTIPAALLMRRVGRAPGFAAASLSAAAAMLFAAWALHVANFALFLAASCVFGINMAFTQQYRYAAAESVAARHVPRAVSFVLVGSIGGALVGPELASRGQFWIPEVRYAGTLLAMAGLYVVQALCLAMMAGQGRHSEGPAATAARPLRTIVRQPLYLVAVAGATAGYGLMTFIMTATPLSMHVIDGFSVEETGSVIRAHVLGMYVPTLVSGFLIERLGLVRMMFAGALALAVTSVIGLQGHSYLHYWWALVLLGVGWNFLYVGGTTMLTRTYSREERFRAQGLNELLVFGSSATTSLLAGTVMHYFGWHRMMLVPLPVLAAVCAALFVVRRDPLLHNRGTYDGAYEPAGPAAAAEPSRETGSPR